MSLRGTGGSGGEFDGFTIDPADADGMLSWLREQQWFGEVIEYIEQRAQQDGESPADWMVMRVVVYDEQDDISHGWLPEAP